MTDYSMYTLKEAIEREIIGAFTENVRRMQAPIISSRLRVIIMEAGADDSFISIAAKFNALANHKTSVDTWEAK